MFARSAFWAIVNIGVLFILCISILECCVARKHLSMRSRENSR